MTLYNGDTAVPTGVVLTTGTPTATTGDTVNPGNTIVVYQNGSASPITVTVKTPRTDKYGGAIADPVSPSIPAGGFAAFGPFEEDLADPDTGLVTLIVSAVTTVKMMVIALD